MHFLCVDLKSRPFQENFFHQILFAGTVHHLTDTLYADMLSEFLAPGGTIHVLDPIFQDKDGWQPRLLRRIDRGRFPLTTERLVELIPAGCFHVGTPPWHTPYGALIKDCDFVHLPLAKL